MANKQQSVLLIEEDTTLAEISAFRLELLGYEVTVLHSAEEALGWLADQLPGMIIVGHFLPGMDGCDFLNRVSNDVRTAELPTMFLSPNADLDDVQKAFNAGADEYLVTPYDPQILEAKVSRLADTAAI